MVFAVSATRGEGVDALLAALTQQAQSFFGAEPSLVSRERHKLALEQSLFVLDRALTEPEREDVLAEELRLAATTLAKLTGRIDVEDVLDVIFRDFCIGK